MDIKEFSKKKREEIAYLTSALEMDDYPKPTLGVIIVGNDPASEIYVRNKEKACDEAGIRNITVRMPESSTTDEVIEQVNKFNDDKSVHGILVQLPLPKHIITPLVLESIKEVKDVDGFCPENIYKLYSYNTGVIRSYFGTVPCTPKGGMMVLNKLIPYPQTEGLNAVVIGRSVEVGLPFAKLLQDSNMTVTVCHSKTNPEDLKFYCKHADVIVSAAGKQKLITADMVKPGAIILDVGINRDENGKLCGDVDYEPVSKVAGFVSPVPGGCGPMTITALLNNTMNLYHRQVDIVECS